MNNYIDFIEEKLSTEEGLKSIEQEIYRLFSLISEAESVKDADPFFYNLENIQFVLAKAVFKNGLNVSDFLRSFIYDYDRIDDESVKRKQYEIIKMKYSSSK